MVNGMVKHQIEAGKDTFYRLKNNAGICWRLVLWLFASKYRKLTQGADIAGSGVKCFIFDDTVILV
ncbi:MAG: hypothetical protein ACK5HT_14200 [Draconibacterium sp.]